MPVSGHARRSSDRKIARRHEREGFAEALGLAAQHSLSMLLITLPLFFPLVKSLGFDPIWFGILVVCVVIAAVVPGMPLRTVNSGVTPFTFADLVRLAILVAFPAISLWLPSMMRWPRNGAVRNAERNRSFIRRCRGYGKWRRRPCVIRASTKAWARLA